MTTIDGQAPPLTSCRETVADKAKAAFDALLDRHPSAVVAAIDGLGAALRLVPGGDGAAFLPGDELLELVLPADRPTVAALWGRARSTGMSSGTVRFAGQPDRCATLHFFDLRATLGWVVGVFVDDAEVGGESSGPPPERRHLTRSAWVSKDACGVYLSVDLALTELLGWSPGDLVGQHGLRFLHPEDHELAITSWLRMLERPGPARRLRLRHRHRDGRWIWLEVRNDNRLEDPACAAVTAELVDGGDGTSGAEESYQRLLAHLSDGLPLGLFHADLDGRILLANRRLGDITGIHRADDLQSQFAALLPEDHAPWDQALKDATTGSEAELPVRLRDAEGRLRHCRLLLQPFNDDGGEVGGLTGFLEDVTDLVRSQRELEVKAATDPLTGCLNRESTLAAIEEMLEALPATPGGGGSGVAVVFIDLDGFKPVNDRLGHAAGDNLLSAVAQDLRGATRAEDVLGRLGGDEFVMACPDVATSADALELARTLARRAFATPPEGDLPPEVVRASVGVAWTDSRGTSAAQLVHDADKAMYQAKRSGSDEPVLSGR